MKSVFLVVYLIYSAVVIIFSFLSKSKEETTESFWTDNRQVGGLRAGLSLSATFMSISWSVAYGIEVFLNYGFGGFFVLSLPWLIVLGIFFIFAPKLRDIPVFSQPELIRRRFGERAATLSAIPILIVFIIWGGAELAVAAKIIGKATDISYLAVLFFSVLVIAIYMSLSGVEAVIVTDVIQYSLIAVFFVILVIAGKNSGVENNSVLVFDLKKINPFFIFLTLIAYLPGWLVETDIWIRLQVTKNGKEARKAMGVAFLNALLFVFLFPMVVAFFVPDTFKSGESAVFYLISLIKNKIILSIVAIGLVAASMSTIDTCLNVAAMTLSYDMKKKKSKKFNIISIWIASLLAALSGIYFDSLKDAFYLSSGIFSTTLFIPVIAAYSKRDFKKGVEAVLLLAPFITILFYILEKYRIIQIPDANGIGYILISSIFSVIIFFTASKISKD
ncbi:hypothetical protein TTHT_1734 [Thermotomaculum hydrothermale]|uniref:Na+/solute symporter n=1 Tax=Thermotomaculum hydrothermale TaxID=981385 RepID=A0A7R6SYZ7_9BACT|nr:hypothetical protein [Thermotomaculum hydrothermale]BBB33205.1 hypothetical protein TTHT_1734 [Thermotomaculum hydrothermale]